MAWNSGGYGLIIPSNDELQRAERAEEEREARERQEAAERKRLREIARESGEAAPGPVVESGVVVAVQAEFSSHADRRRDAMVGLVRDVQRICSLCGVIRRKGKPPPVTVQTFANMLRTKRFRGQGRWVGLALIEMLHKPEAKVEWWDCAGRAAAEMREAAVVLEPALRGLIGGVPCDTPEVRQQALELFGDWVRTNVFDAAVVRELRGEYDAMSATARQRQAEAAMSRRQERVQSRASSRSVQRPPSVPPPQPAYPVPRSRSASLASRTEERPAAPSARDEEWAARDEPMLIPTTRVSSRRKGIERLEPLERHDRDDYLPDFADIPDLLPKRGYSPPSRECSVDMVDAWAAEKLSEADADFEGALETTLREVAPDLSDSGSDSGAGPFALGGAAPWPPALSETRSAIDARGQSAESGDTWPFGAPGTDEDAFAAANEQPSVARDSSPLPAASAARMAGGAPLRTPSVQGRSAPLPSMPPPSPRGGDGERSQGASQTLPSQLGRGVDAMLDAEGVPRRGESLSQVSLPSASQQTPPPTPGGASARGEMPPPPRPRGSDPGSFFAAPPSMVSTRDEDRRFLRRYAPSDFLGAAYAVAAGAPAAAAGVVTDSQGHLARRSAPPVIDLCGDDSPPRKRARTQLAPDEMEERPSRAAGVEPKADRRGPPQEQQGGQAGEGSPKAKRRWRPPPPAPKAAAAAGAPPERRRVKQRPPAPAPAPAAAPAPAPAPAAAPAAAPASAAASVPPPAPVGAAPAAPAPAAAGPPRGADPAQAVPAAAAPAAPAPVAAAAAGQRTAAQQQREQMPRRHCVNCKKGFRTASGTSILCPNCRKAGVTLGQPAAAAESAGAMS